MPDPANPRRYGCAPRCPGVSRARAQRPIHHPEHAEAVEDQSRAEGEAMPAMSNTYSKNETALLIIDPYNDFLSEGGKLWPRAKEVAEGIGLLDHMRAVLAAARSHGFRVFIVPHHQTSPGDYRTWDHLSPTQRRVVE